MPYAGAFTDSPAIGFCGSLDGFRAWMLTGGLRQLEYRLRASRLYPFPSFVIMSFISRLQTRKRCYGHVCRFTSNPVCRPALEFSSLRDYRKSRFNACGICCKS